MSDETPVNNEQATPERTGQQTPPERTFTQAELDQIINARLTREREKYADYDEKSKKLAEIEQAQMSELEKLQKQLDDARKASEQAKAEADIARLEALRLQVATEKGLPAPLAGRLNGATKEELEADAASLLELVKLDTSQTRRGSTDAAAGTRQTSTSETIDLSDDEIAFAQGMKIPLDVYAKRKKETGRT